MSERRPSARRSVLPDLVCLCVFLLMLRLGVWQMHRAEEKEARHRQYVSNRAEAPCDTSSCSVQLAVDTSSLGRPVLLDAPAWLPQQLLLENQTHQGRAGYLLLEALDTRPIVLVQRAWLGAPASRAELPELPLAAVAASRALSAEVAWPPATGVSFAEPPAAEAMDGSVYRLQSLEPEVLAGVFAGAVAPMVLREFDAPADGLLRPWREPRSGADRHRAYAVQWFVMSAVLALVHWNYRRRGHPGEDRSSP